MSEVNVAEKLDCKEIVLFDGKSKQARPVQNCRGCERPVMIWAKTKDGKMVTLDTGRPVYRIVGWSTDKRGRSIPEVEVVKDQGHFIGHLDVCYRMRQIIKNKAKANPTSGQKED